MNPRSLVPRSTAAGAVRLVPPTARMLAAQPVAWLAALGLIALGPWLAAVAPLAINADSVSARGLLKEVAFIGAALGALGGTAMLERLRPAIAHARAERALIAEVLAILAAALAGLALAAGPMLFSTSGSPRSLDLPRLAPPIAALAAGGALLLRVPLASGAAAWILGAGALLAPLLLPDPLPARSLVAVAAALLCAAWLLDHPPERSA